MQFIKKLNEASAELRRSLLSESDLRRAIAAESQIDATILNGPNSNEPLQTTPRANLKFAFPAVENRPKLSHLRGLLDLDKVVVATGFGEVGPFGGSRTRWEMESTGEFSLEGCIEMAWIMGLIAFHHGPLKSNPIYSGWIDVLSKEPVRDDEIKQRYEKTIIDHTGIRLIEPKLFGGYDPSRKIMYQEVSITDDLAPMEVSKEEMEAFKLRHGDSVIIEQNAGQYFIRLLKGSTIMIPKALRFDRLVAGQIPSGWSAQRYGIPEDIISQVDPITLYALVATAEALITSGVTDPYEFYKYVHVSEVGNTSGGGMGGMESLKKIFQVLLS